MMAEAYPKQEFRCLLCSQNYNQLRELPCFHTFCSACLTSYIKAEHVAGDEDRIFFPCPVCDRPTAPTEPNTSVDTWATAFPINPISLAPTAENSDVQDCAACLRDEENSPAEVWCTYCTELLCKQCRVSHKRNKVSAEHKLLPITDARDASGFFDISISENCPTHDKMLDVYCLDHSVMCCSVCVSLLHRTCSNIKSMEEVVRKTMQCSRETEWQEIRDEAEKMLEDDDAEIAKNNSKEKEVLANMAKHVKHAKDHLDGIHAAFQTECSRQFDLCRQQLAFRRQHNAAFHTNSTNTALLMSHQLGSDRQRFITREKAKCQLSGHFRCVDKNTKKQPETFDITLNIETVIGDIKKLTTIGNIDMTSTRLPRSQNAFRSINTLLAKVLAMPSVAEFATSESDLVDSLKRQKLNVWTDSLSCVQTVKRHSLGGSATPILTGSTFTENGELLITDYSNKRLLLFDNTYLYRRDYQIDGQPTCIARGCVAHEIFVAIDRNSILKCTFQNSKLTVISKIPCPQGTHSIAVHGETIVIGTGDQVDLLTMDGKVRKSVERNYYAQCVTVSNSMATFYHFDSSGGIVCRRLDNGEEVFTYKDPSVINPEDIRLDWDNNVYVCGSGSRFKCVYLVPRDGSMGKELIPRLASIKKPRGMAVNPTKHELVVIAAKTEETAFEVYGFSNVRRRRSVKKRR